MTTPLGLTALGVVSLVATSSVLAALLTQLFGWIRDGLRERREGEFAALYLSLWLDAYAKACATLLDDVRNSRSSGGRIGRSHKMLPALPDYPQVNWAALGLASTQQVMRFRVDVEEDQDLLSFMPEVLESEDIVAEAVDRAIARGQASARLAHTLRTRWNLKEPEVSWVKGRLDAGLNERAG